jgi:photosystem II stability/assembly factor-like uncharacterized protein
VIDPASPSTLYAGLGSTFDPRSTALYKSTDAGATWVAVANGLGATNVQAVAIAPSLPSTLYVGVNSRGVLKTTDGASSWTQLNYGLTAVGIYVSALAVDPTTPDTVYVATRPTGRPDTDAMLFKSTDGAAHWRQVPIALPAGAQITSLTIDPVTLSAIYATYADFGYRDRGGIFRSSDGGETWFAAQQLLPAAWVMTLAIDPSLPSRVYAATSAGVFWSPDGATNWIPLNSGVPIRDVWDLAIDRTGSLLRAATATGLYEFQLSAPSRGPISAACSGTNRSGPSSARGSSSTMSISSRRWRSATSAPCQDGSP